MVNERPQVYHGPFSDCNCHGCLEDAKKEAEKRFDSNNLAFGYIKKLENLVNQLQIESNDDYNHVMPAEVYRGGRMRRRSSVESVAVPFDFGMLGGPDDSSAVPVRPKEAVGVDGGEDLSDHGGPKVEIKRMKKSYIQYRDPKIGRDRTTPNALTSNDLSKEYVL
ncbi:MAG: hypothetical protein L6R42_007710, partial [Xanthoria sp. 1 TBL-2021]